MALGDRDFISKEKHELDYVLRKWDKRATQSNRDMLSEALDRFSADAGNEPFTRDLFYSYAEKTGLVSRLEAGGSGGIPSSGDGEKPKKKKWRLWILILIVILAVIFLLLRGCSGCSPDTDKGSLAAPPVTVQTAAPQPPLAPVPPPKKVLTLSGLPADSLVLRFMPDRTDVMAQGEEAKLEGLISGLKNFDEGGIILTGHAASIGYPEGEKIVSEGRARFIAKKFADAGVSRDIVIETRGLAATQMIQNPERRAARALSRRVELTVK